MKKYGTAKTITELTALLNLASVEFGLDVKWYGWDDESIILYKENEVDGLRDEFAYIDNK